MRRTDQNGFTAIELLISLFVAAAFLVSGYQLFTAIIKDGGNARAKAKASNVAYDYMRRYSVSTASPCVASNPENSTDVSVTGLSATSVSVAITCPYSSPSSLSKVEVTVTYNTPQQTVKYATYVNK